MFEKLLFFTTAFHMQGIAYITTLLGKLATEATDLPQNKFDKDHNLRN